MVWYEAPDGGWGWVVVAASFILRALTQGLTNTFGILYVELIKQFQQSHSNTAWIGSIQSCLLYFAGIFASPLIKRFGWRKVTITGSIISAIGFGTSSLVNNLYILYFTYGFLTGIGNGLMFVTPMIAVSHYFDSKRALATGIAVSGSGVGTLTFGVLIQFLIDKVGWRFTMVSQAGIILLGAICGAMYRPLPAIEDYDDDEDDEGMKYKQSKVTYQNAVDQNDPNQSQSNLIVVEETNQECCCGSQACCRRCGHGCKSILVETFDFSIFMKPMFVVFCFSLLAFTFGYQIPYTYTPDRAINLGIDPASASFLISITGIANVLSRLVLGWVSDRSPRIRFWLTGSMLVLGGVTTGLIFLFNNHPLLIVYSILFGTFSGCYGALWPVVLIDLLGIENIERSLGLALGVSSIGMLVSSPLSGWIIDVTQSYDVPFYVVGALQAFGGLIFFSMAWIQSCEDRRTLKKGYQAISTTEIDDDGRKTRSTYEINRLYLSTSSIGHA